MSKGHECRPTICSFSLRDFTSIVLADVSPFPLVRGVTFRWNQSLDWYIHVKNLINACYMRS